MVREVLNMGFNVILSDTDVMWMKDPLPFVSRFPEVDVLMSVDDTATSLGVDDTGLEKDCNPYRLHNTGVYFMRSKENSKGVLQVSIGWGLFTQQTACVYGQEG
jgi:hypothetical protein